VFTPSPSEPLTGSCLGAPDASQIDSLRTVSPAEITRIDKQLAGKLDSALVENTGDLPNRPAVRDYYRQYAGYFKDGQPMVYVQGVLQELLDSSLRHGSMKTNQNSRRRALEMYWLNSVVSGLASSTML
jgi:hypothetical protein